MNRREQDLAFFHGSDAFRTSEDIDVLSETLKNLMEWRHIPDVKIIAIAERSYVEALLRSARAARASNLMSLRLMENFDFFDTQTMDEMLKAATDSPTHAMYHLTPRVSQTICLILLKIHRTLDDFAEMVNEYFRDDMSFCLVFAYSTFPALFGFFTVDYYSDLGADFLMVLMQTKRLSFLVSSMISAYFMSMHDFFTVLWDRYFDTINSSDEGATGAVFVRVFTETAILLSKKHCVVMNRFWDVFPDEAPRVLFEDILMRSLKLYGHSCGRLEAYLKTCVDMPQCKAANSLFAALNVNREYVCRIPRLPPGDHIQRLPFVMSDRDVDIVRQIVDIRERWVADVTCLRDVIPTMTDAIYAPFSVDIVHPNPSRYQACKFTSGEYERYVREIQDIGQKTCTDPVTWLKLTPFYDPARKAPQFCSLREINIATLQRELGLVEVHEANVDVAVDLMHRTTEVAAFERSIERTRSFLLDKFARDCVERARDMSPNTNLTHLLYNVLDIETAKMPMQVCVAVLNLVVETQGQHMRALSQKFHDHVHKVIAPRARSWSDDKPAASAAIVRIARGARRAFTAPMGSRLVCIMGVFANLKSVHAMKTDASVPDWRRVCDLWITECGDSPVFESFLIWKHFVFINAKLRRMLDPSSQTVIAGLFEMFVCVLEESPDLSTSYLEYMFKL